MKVVGKGASFRELLNFEERFGANLGGPIGRERMYALQRRQRMIADLRHRLARLESPAGETARPAVAARTRRGHGTRRGSKRAKTKISAATRKIYQAQGRYMAALRPLTKAARAKVKAIRAKSGVQAAIAVAKRMTT